jgi:tRNA threonylcarbamoyladenosine biosynthesis protein TsaB
VLILALDSSTETSSCALWRDGRVLGERVADAGASNSEALLPAIDRLLQEAAVALADLDAIAFAAGPGSFTGLRVACGIAQGLAFALDIPVVPVGTLDALAAMVDAPRVLVVLDARMREVYFASYQRRDGFPVALAAAAVMPPHTLPLPEGDDWVVAGNALTSYPELAERVEKAGHASRPELLPRAAAVALLAGQMLAAGGGMPAERALPIYVRDKVALTTAERLAAGGRA